MIRELVAWCSFNIYVTNRITKAAKKLLHFCLFFRVVEMLISILLEEGNNNVFKKKRFYDEFTSGEIAMPRKNPKPEDYEKTFSGDTDDNFKIGISLTKKSLKVRKIKQFSF